MLTPLACDPASTEPDHWARRCGFASAGEAARVRREEDRRACAILGAEPVWLPFTRDTPDAELAAAMREALAGAATVLVPGHPRSHPSHARVTRLLLAEVPSAALYEDQPYAMWRLLGRSPERGTRAGNAARLLIRRPALLPDPGAERTWRTLARSPRDWAAKHRAIRAYESQLRGLGRLTPLGIALYERAAGGERVACAQPRVPFT